MSDKASAWMPEMKAVEQPVGWWKTVLDEYPTGVALVTSQTGEGEDLGLIVGTFMAVSEDPPLVSFMPNVASRRAQKIIANGAFCVSVLDASHQGLCEAFAAGEPDAFRHGDWQRTKQGFARLAGARCWFEARITQTVTAGDHEIVIGSVTDLGVGADPEGSPLLFLRGGYGRFSD